MLFHMTTAMVIQIVNRMHIGFYFEPSTRFTQTS